MFKKGHVITFVERGLDEAVRFASDCNNAAFINECYKDRYLISNKNGILNKWVTIDQLIKCGAEVVGEYKQTLFGKRITYYEDNK